MSIADLPIESIDEPRLKELREHAVPEQLRIEYKAILNCATDEEKKEFLRDVSAFANTAGGDIFIGIADKEEIPVSIDGLDIKDRDAELLKLESILRDGLEPKLSGHRVRFIRLASGKYVLLIRIPRSLAAPHRVSFKSTRQFWARRSNGKFSLEINELRQAFLMSETFAEKARAFRVDRVSKLLAGVDVPPVPTGPILIVHLIPLDAFMLGHRVDLGSLERGTREAGPVCLSEGVSAAPNYVRFNLDGLLIMYAVGRDPATPMGFSQWFSSGVVESCEGWIAHPDGNRKRLQSQVFEKGLPGGIKRILDVQRKLGAQTPVLVMLTLSGVRDYELVLENTYRAQGLGGPLDPIDRDLLLIPEVMIESFESEVEGALTPMIKAVWNAAGYAESPAKKRQPS